VLKEIHDFVWKKSVKLEQVGMVLMAVSALKVDDQRAKRMD